MLAKQAMGCSHTRDRFSQLLTRFVVYGVKTHLEH